MSAELIKGMPIANEIRGEIIAEVSRLKARNIEPHLSLLLIGDDESSAVYARSKETVALKLGITVDLIVKTADSSENAISDIIRKLNADKKVHGILLEQPLPKLMNTAKVISALDPKKDVDGAHPINRGFISAGRESIALAPPTALACIELMARSDMDVSGKSVVIVGRGDMTARPLASLLINRNATLTICSSLTENLDAITRKADILITTAGQAGLITADFLSKKQMVVDASMNPREGGGITGDVDFAAAQEIVSAITPVPSGVGSLTTTLIMANLIRAIKLQELV